MFCWYGSSITVLNHYADAKSLLWKPQDGTAPTKSAWGTRREQLCPPSPSLDPLTLFSRPNARWSRLLEHVPQPGERSGAGQVDVGQLNLLIPLSLHIYHIKGMFDALRALHSNRERVSLLLWERSWNMGLYNTFHEPEIPA